ncbi:MAG: insulinase family protein, partial [Acidobacteria bacterium]|nr:insulinase family protein [Acidobacteriota bacterium]
TRFLLDRNSSGKLAHQLGTFESIASFQLLQRMEEKIDGVSGTDLQRVARRIFSKEARTVGWFLPRPETPVIGVEKLAAAAPDPVSGRHGPESVAPTPPPARPVLGPPGHGAMFPVAQLAGRLAGGAAGASGTSLSAEPRPLLGSSRLRQPLPDSWTTRRQVLGNGMVVWIASHPARDSFSLRLNFRAGAARDSDGGAGLAHLSGQLLLDGSDEDPSPAESIESSGVSVGIETNHLATSVHLQGRGEDLDGALASSARMVRSAEISESDFRREQGEVLNELRLQADSGAHRAEQTFRRRIHPYGHPFGRNLKGRPETVQVLQPADVEGFRQRFFRPNRLILSVASNRGIEEVLSAVGEHFGDWEAPEAPEPPPVEAVAPGLGTGRHLIRLGGSSYGTLVYGLPGVSRRHPDYFPMLVLSQVLGQEARLGSAGAGPEGTASCPFGAGGASLEGGVFMIRLGVKPGELESVVTYLREQMADLRDREVTAGEVAAAKNFLLNRMVVSLSSNSGLTAALTQAEWLDPGEDALRDWLDRVHGVTVEQVIDVSRTRLLLDRAATVIAGPEAVLQ